jgi:peptidoglycan/LPS O-acetylase OafA/YrhL
LIVLSLAIWLVLRYQPSHEALYQNPHWATYAYKHLGASVIYGHSLFFGQYPYPNIVLWSLEVEVQFYILAPLLSALFYISSPAIRRISLIALLCLLPLVFRSLPVELTKRVLLFANLPFFFGGLLLADLYLAGALKTACRLDLRAAAWDVCLIAAVAGMVYFNSTVIVAWLIFAMCLAAFKGWASSRILGNPWIVTVGGMCYTIYMYHSLLISLLARGTKTLQTHVLWLDYLIQMAILSALIIPISAVLFLVTERPFMQRNWPEMLWNRVRTFFSSPQSG